MLKIILALLIPYSFCYGSLPLKELSKDEVQKLLKGELITHQKKTTEGPWPELVQFALIKATPLQSASIFAAYDYQQDYVPQLLKSVPIKHISPTEVQVAYEMHMPWPVPNSDYAHQIKVSKIPNGYKVAWKQIRSSDTDKVVGHILFLDYRGQTLMRHQNLLVPSSILAPLLEKSYVKDVRTSYKSIIEHINFLVEKKHPLLKRYSQKINDALNGKYPYKAMTHPSK